MLYKFWILINPLSDVSWQISSPIQEVAFLFCLWFSLVSQHFLVGWSPIFLFFSFVSLAWGDISKEILLRMMSESLLPVFSSSFMVLNLTFKSLIHFEFILVHMSEGGLVYFLACYIACSVQFPQQVLLNRLSLPHCIFLPPSSNINWPYRHDSQTP